MNKHDENILALLRQGGDYVSGEAICKHLAVTRAAVWKHVNALREAGYEIESSRGNGYRLAGVPDIPYACEVSRALTTVALGREFDYTPSTASTNARMITRAEAGAPHGAVLVADHQTAGRGRLTRQWFSPPGVNLYFSLLLRPAVQPMLAPQISLVAGLALARAVEHIRPDLAPKVKWPNDVFLDGLKLSGILCDMRAEADRVHYLVVGVGINVNVDLTAFPEELIGKATSLKNAAGGPVSRAEVLAAFLNEMEVCFEEWETEGLGPLIPALEERSYQRGMRVTIESGADSFSGIALGFSPNGGLLVDTGGERPREVICGDVLPVHDA
ncbi:MAG: biotin--[acetyl-CoA-carboxylase] ligase [Lentisphaeria bacterium]|nr:biotin--[acetyl-CoA-carboxylase] ligase [Lentisphaeria bacterium]